MKKRIWLMLLLMIAGSAGVSAQAKMTAEQYIDKYKTLAVDEMKRTGIPASITLAQGLIESGNGNSYLARESNNHFGIKCKKDWGGKSVSVTDDAPDECFRAYRTAEESYRDHSDFLVNGQRYAFLFELDPTDYKGWANGLKQAGYATNPRYPDMIISVVERYSLYQYDKGNKRIPKQEQIVQNETEEREHISIEESGFTYNGIPAYKVKKGETYDEITKKFSLWHFQLRKYNDLPKNTALPEGTVLYLKGKKRKGDNETYKVQQGENMDYISQITGVKVKRLYKLNRMEKEQQPAVGEVLNLRKKRDNPPKLNQEKTLLAWQPLVIKPKPEPIIKQTPTNQKTVGTIPSNPVPDNPLKDISFHTVVAGENLPSISKTYSVSMESLLEWNNIPDSSVRIGQLLRVKAPNEEVKKTADGTPTEILSSDSNIYKPKKQIAEQKLPQNTVNSTFAPSKTNSNTTSNPTTTVKTNPTTTTSTSTVTTQKQTATDGNIYIVQTGETLYAISRKTGLSVDELRQLNGLIDNTLSVGQQLIIKAAVNKQVIGTKISMHTVQPGDTMYSISKKYGITIDQIRTWNSMDSTSLKIGQELIISK